MRTDSVFSISALQGHLALLLISGISLLLSIQPASPISVLRGAPVVYSPIVFPLVTTLAFGLFAIARGALLAGDAGSHVVRARLLLRVIQHVSFGLVAVFPLCLYSRSILQTRAIGVVVLMAYMFLLGVFACVASFRVEARRLHAGRSAFAVRYGLYIAFCLVPFVAGTLLQSVSILVIVSPIGFAVQAVGGVSIVQAIVGCAVPCIGLIWILARLPRVHRRYHAF